MLKCFRMLQNGKLLSSYFSTSVFAIPSKELHFSCFKVPNLKGKATDNFNNKTELQVNINKAKWMSEYNVL